jgi:putative ABC transport system permease protein
VSLTALYDSVTYWPRLYVGLWKISAIRLVYDPLLAICLLIGWTSAVALTSALPMYTDAVNHALLGQELETESQSGRRPAFAFFYHYVGGSSGGAEWERYQALRAYMAAEFAPELGLPVQAQMHAVKSDLFQIFPTSDGSYTIGDKPLLRGYAGFVEGIEPHITIIEGAAPAPTIPPGEPLEVLMRPEVALEAGLQVGEILVLYDPGGPSAQGPRPRTEIPVRIAGLWEANDPNADMWYLSPASFRNVLLMPESAYVGALATQMRNAFYDLSWYTHFSGDRVRAQNVPGFLGRVSRAETRITSLLPGTYLELSPVEGLRRYQRTASAQTVLLLVFGIPVLGLILYFIMLIAGSSVERQRLEIATLKSRGASSGQVLGTYLLQGAFLGLVALFLGPQAGRLLAQLIGGAQQFLTFQLQAPLNVMITSTSLWFAVVALALALFATLLPAMNAARMTIVHAKQDVGRAQWAPGRRPFWQRFFVDLQLLGASGYGYYLLKTQGRIAFLELGAPGDPLANPILFLAPTLFIFSATLFCVRIFPLLTWLLSWLSARFNSLPILLALRNLARSSHAYAGLLLLLILTTSLGTFTASMTRTLDENLVARINYRVGADVVLTEGAGVATLAEPGEAGQIAADTGELPAIWINLPVDDHRRAPGVEAVTRMGKFGVSTQQGNQLTNGVLYGIDRIGFPGAAYFRQDFAAESLGSLMNALALEFSGVIVSQSFLDEAHLAMGDTVALRGLIPTSNQAIDFTIVGGVSLFPTVYPQDGPVFIANLDYIFSELGQELPYKVWLGVDDAIDIANLTEALNELGYKVLAVEEANALVAAAQKQPTRVGVFGFLSVGLITTTALSMLTLATYAVLSYRQRFIQLGILRAIGLAPRQLAISLGSEQVIITLLAVAAGVQLGLLASHLFIPFLQIGYREGDLVPPFVVAIAWDDVARLVAAMLGAMLVTTGAIVGLLLRLQTFKAVKLGEVLTS